MLQESGPKNIEKKTKKKPATPTANSKSRNLKFAPDFFFGCSPNRHSRHSFDHHSA
jgi:hypothetical protein